MGDSEQADIERFSSWLQALADEVKNNPELAARIQRQTGAGTPVQSLAPSIPVESTASPAAESNAARQSSDGSDALEPNQAQYLPQDAIPAPVLRHRRRSSKYGPPTIEGRTDTGVPDPRRMLAEMGEDGLMLELQNMRAGTLRAIIRTYQFDPDGTLPIQATEKKMIAVILKAIRGEKKTTRKKK